MEKLELISRNPDPNFWRNRSVFLTGHTGFKGGWIALWLSKLGAKVHGYALDPPTNPSFFEVTQLQATLTNSVIGDIRDFHKLWQAIRLAKPSVVIHMAAQPLVRQSYVCPTDTFAINVLGTVNLLEAARGTDTVQAIVNVTTDKCYENKSWFWAYRENDRLGGYDPYSSSKACAELAAAAYRNSFLADAGINLAMARAGNVIGGGDWAADRLISDFFRAIEKGEALSIRSPNAIRPWQHVLEPLSGYLMLAENLVIHGADYAEAWNFGPRDFDPKPVSWVIDYLCQKIPNARWELDTAVQPHEAASLTLDSAKAKAKLGWAPKWSLEAALENTVNWYLAWKMREPMDKVSFEQIALYQES